jgi:hypothetical protein
MNLRKIPLEPLIEILKDIYDNGADFVDISGENNAKGENKRDVIKITIKPEYLAHDSEDDINDNVFIDYTNAYEEDIITYSVKDKPLSDNDINDLI